MLVNRVAIIIAAYENYGVHYGYFYYKTYLVNLFYCIESNKKIDFNRLSINFFLFFSIVCLMLLLIVLLHTSEWRSLVNNSQTAEKL